MEKRGESTEVRMHAVVVGCTYPNTDDELMGCDHNVVMMQNTLIRRFGFDPNRIVAMVDRPGSKGIMPTGHNIKKALSEMIGKAKPGDTLFFHFSGHGMCYGPGSNTHAIVPSDDNLITHVDLRDLVNRLPQNATFTILADCCCSGGLIDKEPIQVGLPFHKPDDGDDKQPRNMISYETYLARLSSKTGLNSPDVGVHLVQLFGSEASLLFRLPHDRHPPKPLRPDEGILLSASEPHKYTYGDLDENGVPCGAFTKTVVAILKAHPAPITNKELVLRARGILRMRPEEIRLYPCLYCSGKNADVAFLGEHA